MEIQTAGDRRILKTKGIKDRLHKQLYDLIVKPGLGWYLKHDRYYNYRGMRFRIRPGVFHPGFFFSTEVLLDWIETLDLRGKIFCEVGSGSGLVSAAALCKGATVCAFDINPVAVEGLKENISANFGQTGKLKVYCSDMFDSVPVQKFEVVAINPPYFFEERPTAASYAWYCGNKGEFFIRLFDALQTYTGEDSDVFMTLAENCNFKKIEEIAAEKNYYFTTVKVVKVKWELNYIISIKRK